MKYQLRRSKPFERWLKKRSAVHAAAISGRLQRMRKGAFGDHHYLRGGVWELRFMGGAAAGLRIYYGFRGEQVILLCRGGDKSSQADDINTASTLLKQWED